MQTFLIEEVYSVEAESLEAAIDAARLNSNKDSVIIGGDRLGSLLNPVHHAECQANFGNVAPPATEEVEVTESE